MTAPTTRTDGIDFAALIEGVLLATAEQYGRVSIAGGAENLIAAKVSELCPESGSHDDLGPIPSLGCDLCPTIGQMLREWQALTALAEYAQHDGMCGTSQAYGPITCDCGLDAARAALEAVRGA